MSENIIKRRRSALFQPEAACSFLLDLSNDWKHLWTLLDEASTRQGHLPLSLVPGWGIHHCAVCVLFCFNKISRRSYSQENWMFSLAFLNCGQCLLISSSFPFGKADITLSMLGECTRTYGSGKIWYLLAYTQNDHSPTSVQGKAGFPWRGPTGPPVVAPALCVWSAVLGLIEMVQVDSCLLDSSAGTCDVYVHAEPSVGLTFLNGSEIWDWTLKTDY